MISPDVVAAKAKIEGNQSLNGSEKGSMIRTKVYDAYGGKARNGKGEEVGINQDAFVSPYAYKYTLKLDDSPVTFEDIKGLNPLLRTTKGWYIIKYTPRNSGDRKKGRPFKIGQDFIRWDVRVSGPSHWHYLAKVIPEFGWLERNSTLTDELFDIAVMHPGMSFLFTVKWVEYSKKIQELAPDKESSEHPLVAMKIDSDDYEGKYKEIADVKLQELKTTGSILKEINAAERDPAVQAEMLKYDGEIYVRGRNTLRDPKTGRLLKHKKGE